MDAAHYIVEEIDLRVRIFDILDRRAEAVMVEFVEQGRERSLLHLLLVKRLHGGEPRGGPRFRAGGCVGHRRGHRHSTRPQPTGVPPRKPPMADAPAPPLPPRPHPPPPPTPATPTSTPTPP